MCHLHSTAPGTGKSSAVSTNNFLPSVHSLIEDGGTVFLVQGCALPHLFFSQRVCVGALCSVVSVEGMKQSKQELLTWRRDCRADSINVP